MEEYLSHSEIDTFELGVKIGQDLPVPTLVSLFGELGVGKTTFIKGLVFGATKINPDLVQSPTFTYMHVYEGEKIIYHFDLYRIKNIDEFLSMGFDEYFEANGICCIEWSERIASSLPSKCLCVSFKHVQENHRLITISKK